MQYSEKRLLESAAINIFVELYNEKHCTDFKVIRIQERPDAVLENSIGDQLGLEVTHLYYDGEEAKMLFGRSKRREHGIMTFDTLLDGLEREIMVKEKKLENYMGNYPIVLLIRNASPIFSIEDFDRIDITVNQTQFHEIWFVSRNNTNNWEMRKLNSATNC